MGNIPGYVALCTSGEIDNRIRCACELLTECTVCPRECHVNRIANELGFCQTGVRATISSSGQHFGEEPLLVGHHGSGTIFVTHCNLACEFCQNYEISQCGAGEEVSCEALAEMMIRLQQKGCHNINIVTPTHIVPPLIKSVRIAAEKGLSIPLVYNCGGYESVSTIRLLDGIVDIYMPDAKYGNDEIALALSHAPRYVDTMKAALIEMHRQVGDLVIDNGIAVRGLLIRHLVLPENLAGSDVVLPWIAAEISPYSYVNIMAQYHPAWHTACATTRFPALLRPITTQEYHTAIRIALDCGLCRGFSHNG
ncbi:MAG: radical SAM protein [Methanoregula sp.]|nr:radical SAM protein [Methanoregula sp.]